MEKNYTKLSIDIKLVILQEIIILLNDEDLKLKIQ